MNAKSWATHYDEEIASVEKNVAGFNEYIKMYTRGMAIEHAAVDANI